MFREELDKFGDLGKVSGDLGLEEMSEDLLKASKLIRIAVEGGTDFRGINTEYKGLANIEGVDEAVASINKLKGALSLEISDGTSIGTNENTTGVGIMNVSAENVDLRAVNSQAPAASNVAVQTDNSTTRGGDTIMMAPPKPSKTREQVASR
jgi:hypothetical protein